MWRRGWRRESVGQVAGVMAQGRGWGQQPAGQRAVCVDLQRERIVAVQGARTVHRLPRGTSGPREAAGAFVDFATAGGRAFKTAACSTADSVMVAGEMLKHAVSLHAQVVCVSA